MAAKSSIEAAVAKILDTWGHIHIWVNNAGIFDNTPLAEGLSPTARWMAANAAARDSGLITALPLLVTLMFGPRANASPQKHRNNFV